MVSISVKVTGMIDIDKFKKKLLENIASNLKVEAVKACRTSGKVQINYSEWIDKEPITGTGNFIASIQPGHDLASGTAWIGTVFPHAPYLEFGTGIYGKEKKVIKAKKTFMKFKKPVNGKRNPISIEKETGEKNIAFEKDGYIFTKMIRGMRPRPFMRPALFQVGEKMEEIINQSLKETQVG